VLCANLLPLISSLQAALHSIVGSDEALQASVLASVEVNAASGETQVSADPVAPAPPRSCESRMDCQTCVFEGTGCAWCVMGRMCRPDRAWECQGEQDHVGLSGIGHLKECPNMEAENQKRADRKRRKAEAAVKLEEDIAKHKSLLQDQEKAKAKEGKEGGSSGREKEPYDKIERWNELKRRRYVL